MEKIKKALMAFIVFLYFASFAYAQSYSLFSGKIYDLNDLKEAQEKIEFEFYNGTYNVCGSEKKTIPILIANNANYDNRFSLDAAGASWISLNVKEFLLPKRQSVVALLELNPGQNANGRYDVKVNGVSSAENAKRELSLDINVEKCYSLNLELEKEQDKVCGGTKKQYSGQITNGGNQKSDANLMIKGPNWISAGKNTFSVGANDRKDFELSADVPANAKGVFNVIVGAVMQNLPLIKSEKSLKIEVVPKYDCYKADVIADSKITNYYSNAYATIKIRNNGARQAVYDINIESPNWIDIEPKKLTANPQQFANLNLNINPDAGIPEGTYGVKINVKFEDIVYSKNIDVVLSKNRLLRESKSFFIFYQYYIYAILFILIVLSVFRRRIAGKIKASYKSHKIRQSRLRALEIARKARQEKSNKISAGRPELKLKLNQIKKYHAWASFLIVLIIIASILFFSIQKYDFPVSKIFVKTYYLYIIAGILISFFIIFAIEFYKPLSRLLKGMNNPKKKK